MMRLASLVLLSLTLLASSTPIYAQGGGQDEGARPTGRQELPMKPDRSVELDTDEGTWISLDVSPDGRTIVFDLLGDLYTLPIAGGDATQLTKGMAFDAQPRFSPDGRHVVFTSDRDGADNVWLIDVETKQTKQVSRGRNNRFRSPEWTPDGRFIVVSRASSPIGTSKPVMYHRDGGSGVQLVRDPTPLPPGNQRDNLMGAAFGNDDRYIWFAEREGSWEYNAGFPQWRLLTFDRRTGRRETRANMLGGAFRPALSPDGRYLVFGSRHEAQTGLRIRDLEQNSERWLAFPVQRDEQESVASLDVLPGYSFTPDSRAVIVSYGGKIWRVPVDGSAATPVSFRVRTQLELGPKVHFTYRVSDSTEFIVRQIRDAVPSPDGRQLAFVAMDKLYVMDYPAGAPRRVTTLDGTEAQPAWSPDGQWIAFVTWTREGGQLWKVRPTGGRPVQLTQGTALYMQPAWSADASRIVLLRGSAQSFRESGGSMGPNELVWVPANGGRATYIASGAGRNTPHFTAADTGRIFVFGGSSGLISLRWDGTDERTHLRITGARAPEATQPAPAISARVSPTGDQVLVQVANDLLVVPFIVTGEPPTINLANPSNAELPARRLTEVGGAFPAWRADGRHVHWSIGSSHFVYDLERARQVDDSIDAAARARADSARARGDTARPAADTARRAPGDTTRRSAQSSRYQPVETSITIRAQRDIPRGSALFRGARIVTMKGDDVIENGELLVRDNRIVAVGPAGSLQAGDARVIDVRGKTIVPGFVDTHAHLRLNQGIHQQPWSYLANLAYGVTTTRDPQTGTTDVLSYEDAVTAGSAIGPRIYSTGPGLFSTSYQPAIGDEIRDLEHARRIMKRYSQYYDTKTLKMYIGGNRQQRQWIMMAAKEQRIMPTTEGALDFRYDMTMAIDGYPGQEHSLPLFPIYTDVTTLFANSGTVYTPTLLVAYGGPWGENFWYASEIVYDDPKLRRFTPYEELAGKSRRRIRSILGGGNSGGWFMKEEHVFDKHAKGAADIVKAGGRVGIGSHGQLQGLGYHWELWSVASGGLSNMEALRAATLHGADAIGLADDLGSLEPGKLADLLVLDLNPLENIRNTNSVRMVMKNGRLYDGNTLDEIHPRQRRTDPVLGTPERPRVNAGIR